MTAVSRDPGPGYAFPALAVVGACCLALAGVALASQEAEASPPPVPPVQVCYAAGDGPSSCGAELPPGAASADQAAILRGQGASAGAWVGGYTPELAAGSE